MDVLLAALSVFFIVELVEYWIAIRARYVPLAELALAGLSLLVVDTNYWLGALAIAGLAHALKALFRLVQAWADRIETANLAEILPNSRRTR